MAAAADSLPLQSQTSAAEFNGTFVVRRLQWALESVVQVVGGQNDTFVIALKRGEEEDPCDVSPASKR